MCEKSVLCLNYISLYIYNNAEYVKNIVTTKLIRVQMNKLSLRYALIISLDSR